MILPQTSQHGACPRNMVSGGAIMRSSSVECERVGTCVDTMYSRTATDQWHFDVAAGASWSAGCTTRLSQWHDPGELSRASSQGPSTCDQPKDRGPTSQRIRAHRRLPGRTEHFCADGCGCWQDHWCEVGVTASLPSSNLSCIDHSIARISTHPIWKCRVLETGDSDRHARDNLCQAFSCLDYSICGY
jgi:hypothetical protein